MISSALAVVGLLISSFVDVSLALPAQNVPAGGIINAREASFEQDPATYDDACNIGYCAINGA